MTTLQPGTESPERPTGGRPRRMLGIVVATLRAARDDRITMMSASLGFHWFLALFPAALVLIGISHLVGLSTERLHSLVHGIGTVMPAATANILQQAVTTPAGATTGRLEIIVGSVIALWSATEAMAALQVGLDVAYSVERDRGFFGRRLMGVPLLLVTLVLGGTASAILVFGNPIRSLLPHHMTALGTGVDLAWDVVRWGAAAILGTLLLSTYYNLGPSRDRIRWRWVTTGSVVALVGWLAASLGFSFYVSHFGHTTKSYGAFADVAVLLLWLYATGLVVLLGAELNHEIERSRVASPA